MRLHGLRALTALILATAALVGCGDGGGTLNADRGSDSATEESPLSAAASVVRTAAMAPSEHDTVTMDYSMTMDGALAMSTRGTVSISGDRGDLVTSTPMGDIRMLMIDGLYYMQFPDLPGGMGWVQMDPQDIAGATGLDPSAASGTGVEATDWLGMLADVGEVRELGPDTLFGLPVEGYRSTVGRETMIDLNLESGVITEQLADEMRRILPPTYDIDLWVDADGLPRRQTWNMSFSPLPGEPPAAFGYRIDFTDWGAPLEVTAPPTESVITMDELLGAERS